MDHCWRTWTGGCLTAPPRNIDTGPVSVAVPTLISGLPVDVSSPTYVTTHDDANGESSSAGVNSVCDVNDQSSHDGSESSLISSPSLIKCILFNSQSLCNKFSTLKYMLENDNFDILCITETWLKPSIPDSCFVNCSDFSVWRSDRTDNVGGGACIITKNTSVIASPVIVSKTTGHADVCAIDIHCKNYNVRLINVYRPPRSTTALESVESMKALVNCLVDLCNTSVSVILVGDFNLPDIDWSFPDVTENNYISRFNLFILRYAFEQFVKTPTRGANLLDLIFCNDESVVTDVIVDAPFSTSDHNSVTFSILLPFAAKQEHLNDDSVRFNFSKADWPSVNQYLESVDWSIIFQDCESCDSLSSAFYSVVYDCFDRFVPRYKHKSISGRNRKNYPAYLRKLMSRKLAVWHKLKCQPSPDLHKKYRQLCSQVKAGTLSADAQFEKSLVEAGNLGKFFRYAGSKFKNKRNVGLLVGKDGKMIYEASEKAEILSDYFKSVFVVDDRKSGDDGSSCSDHPTSPDSLCYVNFSTFAITKILRKLKVKSAGGPDLVPPVFLKNCSSHLSYPLSYIFNVFFQSGYLPSEWRLAFITPVFKKGDATCPNNYRPISLTCTLCKIMEVVIKDVMVHFLLRKKLISKRQHAFIQRHSTITNLLESVHEWNLILRSRHSVDVLYVDFSRAFDSVVHSKLLLKLSNLGIGGALLRWIGAFLVGRKQCVVVENCFSNWSDVVSGVPQGSVLGPILFLIFINDVVEISNCCSNCSLFADDLKIYSAVDTNADRDSLQVALDKLVLWCKNGKCALTQAKPLSCTLARKILCSTIV